MSDQEVVIRTDPGSLLQLAIEKGMDMNKLSQLLDIYQRWEAEKAKKAYFEALAKFQEECPEIKKTKSGYNNHYKYAPLSSIINQIKPYLKKYGFSFTFSEDQTDDSKIKIFCHVHHKDGHTESTSLSAIADTSGNMNGLQGIGSTVSYLRRYTLESVLGIATAEEDNDGQSYVQKENTEIKELRNLADKMIDIMVLEIFDDKERGKFKKWLYQNKTVESRQKKLKELEAEKERRVDAKFNELEKKLDRELDESAEKIEESDDIY